MDPWMLIAAGLVYASVFVVLAYSYPQVALLAILASSPINHEISGAGPKLALAEINLILTLPVVFLRGRRLLGWPIIAATGVYLGAGALCSLVNWRDATLVSLIQMAIYMWVAVLVFASVVKSQEDYRLCLNGFILVTTFLAASVAITRSPFVLGIHKNNIGQAVAAGLLVNLELCFHEQNARRKLQYYALLLVQSAGLIITLSRGSWMGAILGTLAIFALRRQFGLMLRVGALLTVLAVVGWSLLPQESKNYATGLSADDWNIKMRYQSKDLAMSQFNESPLIGVGVGYRKEYDATNLVFLILAETGVVGIATFAIIPLFIAFYLWRTQRGLPRSSFSFSLVAIAGATLIAKFAHGMVDHYWVRGTLMCGWASLGMVAKVVYDKKVQRRQRLKARRQQRSAALQAAQAPLAIAAEPVPLHG